ncbi:MAG TPA: undecaprenyldiphospho-muramoylpentapeptide beta-N-acetylglucosaminyltransferase [Desulfobulbus sp.]|nr:undecaprenyldiphospho-muramoylpentapeptide beta-N-acetylglucosaminyltransferase [Desulfobulbus sp.]
MRLIITGGGTGGHLFPALAVAEGIGKRDPGSEILFVGAGRRIDNQVLAEKGFARKVIKFSGIKGLGMSGFLHAASRLPLAIAQSFFLIRRFRPDLVFGVGGYVTGPVLAAAKLLRVPICIHEQNSVPGLANRLAGKLADRICISLPCQPSFAKEKTVVTGNPVRREIIAAASKKKTGHNDPATILVLGGSQGARRVNELVLAAMKILQEEGSALRIIHQTGTTDEALIRKGYEERGIEAEVASFFSDMADVYGRADLVVSRAGATTLAELAVMGMPALLIPYPFAADDHQTTNGEYYVNGGGALMVQEKKLDGDGLAEEIRQLADNPEKLGKMAAAMGKMGRPEATDRIVDVCMQLVNHRSTGRRQDRL